MEGVDKRFPGVHALRSVNFDLRHGEVHALMGENGAGKSTLMKVLAGIYPMDAGRLRIAGQDVHMAGPRSAQAHGISIIHQELSLMNELTVAQNIFIGREPQLALGRLDEAALNSAAAAIFASMNLTLDPRAEVGTLTVAKQQMVEIAKALSFDSRVLIMDEPSAALNDTETNELFAIIRRLKSQGVGIIYISHKMDELKRIADRVTVMRDGQYIATVPAADTPMRDIIAMMVGRALADSSPDIPDLSTAPVALEVRGLKRGRTIRDVSFSVKQGEILGFAGLMGAGRTEVARAIFGADPLDEGELYVHGKRCDIQTPQDAVSAGIGYLSEDRKHFGLAVSMDVRNNVALASMERFANPAGVLDDPSIAKTADTYIDQLSIRTPSNHQEVRLLSGGNQQKVVIAKWLLRDCDILIFDEPTRGIDVGAKSEIYKLLHSLAAQGRAIIVISSELPEVLRLSHRVAVLCEGRLTGILPGGANTSQEAIMELATQPDSGDETRADSPMPSDPQPRQPGPQKPWSQLIARLSSSGMHQKLLAFASLIALLISFSLASPNFLQMSNIIAILQATSVNGVLAIAATLVIITGGIDLSVGTLMTFCAVIAGVVLTMWGMPLGLGIVAAIAAGAGCGLLSGTFISKMKIPPFIATLGMMLMLKGLSLVISGTRPIYFNDTPNFTEISRGSLIGSFLPDFAIPNGVLILFLVALAAGYTLERTILGRYTFALGSNEEAVRLSGVNTEAWKMAVYALAGGICGIGGLLIASRLNSAQPALGLGYELEAIAAVVIGGTSLAGGRGTVLGTLIGAFIMSVLANGLRILSVTQEWQTVMTGAIIILAVYADMMRKRRNG